MTAAPPPPRRRSAGAVLALSLAVGACVSEPQPGTERARGVARVAASFSQDGLKRLTADMDPAMLALARRHDPIRHADRWGRPTGWASLDLRLLPTLGFGTASGADAETINGLRAFSPAPINPMRPFNLRTDTADGGRALRCLSQAVYFESAREPGLGQAAVAQVVLNRVRHPAYPKSICGVVYQGAARGTGCQFTFTCDGSLKFAPQLALWDQAQAVARRALGGFVVKDVGPATHYHADYVAPYWAPTLVKMTKIGAHIFYRWTGPWGEPPAFRGRYAGGEANLSAAILQGEDARTQGLFDPEGQGLPAGRKVTLSVAGEVRTYTVADPTAKDGQKTRVLGSLTPARRKPTPEEVKAINESLAAMEKANAAPAAPPPN
jgi:spore germination cell wall hydrolase CwlJ-like protein